VEKIEKKVVATIIGNIEPMTVMGYVKGLKIGGVSVHYVRFQMRRPRSSENIRISRADTVVTCDRREPLRQLRAVIRKERKCLGQKPLVMNTYSVIIKEDKNPFYA